MRGDEQVLRQRDNEENGAESNIGLDDDDLKLGQGFGGGLMSQGSIQILRNVMLTMIIPAGASILPTNLGSAKYGRLKAAQWLTLYTLVMPLVILDIYIEGQGTIHVESNRGRFLQNTGDLIQCMRIACTRVLRDGHVGRFYNSYSWYTVTLQKIFKNPRVKPNHHYALHIPEELKIWGPLLGVAAFSGERIIGILQKIPTNGKIG
ncbi:hypothetical protein O181_054023 [Austropuccinia psidii MF-1]|uniref:Uncharacterized protein n=1 Tax=Austropuccinia psidii MF-1 TaxID=1389203 RepID=A0A9Q3E5H7_9BASI|nr:hypothetical protein [Austropuccinia psidii MF-1]